MARGYSFIEMLMCVTVVIIICGIAVPLVQSSLDRSRAAAAARYLASQLALGRMEAVKRSTFVALRFEKKGDGFRFSTYIDGNGNGIRSTDVARRIDVLYGVPAALEELFPGVTFGLYEDVLPITPEESLIGGDPIRIGRSEFLSFSPLGSATSGTVYIRGRGKHQFAVRVLGVTGRVNVLRFDFVGQRWIGP